MSLARIIFYRRAKQQHELPCTVIYEKGKGQKVLQEYLSLPEYPVRKIVRVKTNIFILAPEKFASVLRHTKKARQLNVIERILISCESGSDSPPEVF